MSASLHPHSCDINGKGVLSANAPDSVRKPNIFASGFSLAVRAALFTLRKPGWAALVLVHKSLLLLEHACLGVRNIEALI